MIQLSGFVLVLPIVPITSFAAKGFHSELDGTLSYNVSFITFSLAQFLQFHEIDIFADYRLGFLFF